jgi:hypothetical protein
MATNPPVYRLTANLPLGDQFEASLGYHDRRDEGARGKHMRWILPLR